MEENNRQLTTFEHREVDHVRQTIERMVVLFMAVVGLGLVGLVGYGVWLVRQWLPYLGIAALIAALLVVAALAAWPILLVIRAAHNMGHIHIGEFGTVVNNVFGRTLYAPLTANAAKTTRYRNRVKIQQEVPTIMELIESGVIAVGQMIMHMGFEAGKGGLVPVVDKWPGTFAIPGQGRSGKTRRAITVIFQAIIGGAKVIVLDPHHNKPDGIARLLAPLDRWITIVRGEENCAAAAAAFLNEMERRVSDSTGGPWRAWFILIDEWSRLMTTNNLSDEEKAMLVDLVTGCSTQYAGYFGFAGIIGQIWTEAESGGTTIRRTLHHAFVHRLSSEYAKFFLKGKWVNKAEELSTRECIYREGPTVKMVMTTTVPDDAIDWFVCWLEEHMPVDSLPLDPVPFALPGQSANVPMIESPAAGQHSQRTIPDTPHQHELIPIENVQSTENWPQKPIDTGELFSVSGETVRIEENEENYTKEEEQAVIQAIIAISGRGDKLTRTAIRDELGWHGREFTRIVKPVCDKFKVAVKE